MLNIFKRTKLYDWELPMLETIFRKLSGIYEQYAVQIDAGLYVGVNLDFGDIPGYVNFKLDPTLRNKYLNSNSKEYYTLTDINIFDKISKSNYCLTIYISSGIVNGYSIVGPKKLDIDIANIDISKMKVGNSKNPAFSKLSGILNNADISLIDLKDVYEIELEHKLFFHIKDIEDGDFIGLDESGNMYRITHEPLQIILMDKPLNEILND